MIEQILDVCHLMSSSPSMNCANARRNCPLDGMSSPLVGSSINSVVTPDDRANDRKAFLR